MRPIVHPTRPWIVVALFCALSIAAASASAADRAPAAGEVGPSFSLFDQHGRTRTDADFRGKPTVLHFGFTSCPVVCPTTLYEVAETLRALGMRAGDVNFLFVTVDPDRDTAAALKDYIAGFDERIVGLTGERTEIERFARALGATAERVEQPGGGYEMAHTVYAFVFDADWQRAGTLYMGAEHRKDLVMKRLAELVH